MIEALRELLENEEVYIMSLVHASEKLDSDVINTRAEGVKLYYYRIKDRIQKEIIDVYSDNSDSVNESTDNLSS